MYVWNFANFVDIEYFMSQTAGTVVQDKKANEKSDIKQDKQQTSVVMAPSEHDSLCLKLGSANDRAETAENNLHRALQDLQRMR